MELTVRGGKKHQRQLARLIARKVIPNLVGTRLYQKISLDIVIRKDLQKREQMYGSCDWLDHNERPKFYEIELDDQMSFKNTAITICHELIHLKQFAKGQLKDYGHSEKARWMQTIVNHERVKYHNLPWEKEAYALQNKVFIKMLKTADCKTLTKLKNLKSQW